LNGEAGYQAQTLGPGLYFGYWFWQYTIDSINFINISSGEIGLVKAKDGAPMPVGQILARKVECDDFQDAKKFLESNGTKGRQTAILTTGLYRINTHLFEGISHKVTEIDQDKVGIITVLDGQPLLEGEIAGNRVAQHNNFQDPDTFLNNNGSRGLQSQIILAGSYNLNPWFVDLEIIEMTTVPIGHVGVVVSYFGTEGKDTTGAEFKHGNIVAKESKGVWGTPLDPGKYAINKYIFKVELVPTTNIVLN